MFSSDMNEGFFYSSVPNKIIHIAVGLVFILVLPVIYYVPLVASASMSVLEEQNEYYMGW